MHPARLTIKTDSSRPFFCAGALCLSVILSGCQKPEAPEQDIKVQPIELIAADLVTIETGNAVEKAKFTGTLRPINQSNVQSQVSAIVSQVNVQVGQTVSQNQVLIELNNQDNQARLAQARANLAATQAQATQARNMMNRKKRLLDQGFISQVEYEQSQVDHQAQVENLRAQQANVDIALKAQQDGLVRSPINGVVTQRNVEPGQSVASGQTLFEIVDPSKLEIQAKIGSDQQALLKIGQAIEFRLQANPERYTAQVSRISPVADMNSRQLEFFAQPQQKINNFSIGSFIEGELIAEHNIEGQKIPLNTLITQNNQYYVWAVRDQKIQKIRVDVLEQNYSQNTAIVNGLTPSDRISRVAFQDTQANQSVIISP